MDPKNKSILTEDGQRLTIEDGAITGTEDTGPGLSYEESTIINKEGDQDENQEQRTCENDKQ